MDSTRPSATRVERSGPSKRTRQLPVSPYRVALAGAILIVLVASWAWLVWQDWAMRHMDVVDMAMPANGPWALADAALVFTMWAVMMVAMMLPTALPMLLAFRRTDAARATERDADVRTALFAIGYVATWMAFSAAATGAQWALHAAGQVSAAMQITNRWIGAGVLIVAGLYQWSGWKDVCLRSCRSPLAFILNRWSPGPIGAFRMGVEHGGYCAGCCWLLMTLLFVVGVMNVAWIVALTLYVLAEKIAPANRWLARASGAALVGWGIGVAWSTS